MESNRNTAVVAPPFVEVPIIDPPGEPEEDQNFGYATDRVRKSLSSYIPAYRRKVLEKVLAETQGDLKLIEDLAAMESQVRGAVAGLDLRTRAVVAMIVNLNYMEGVTNSVRYGNDIVSELAGDEETIEKAREQFADDPAVQTLYGAYRLQERIDQGEGEDAGPTAAQVAKLIMGAAAAAENEQPGTTPLRRLSLDKARDEVCAIVEWLQGRTIQEKLAAVAASILLNGDVESHITMAGGYKGDIGHDLDTDWTNDVADLLANKAAQKDVPQETLMVASYIMGVDKASY